MNIAFTKRALMVFCHRLVELEKVRSNRQDYTLAWLDIKVDKNDEHTRKLTRKLSDHIEIFTNVIECYQYLSDKHDPVFLIISGSCAAQCLPVIHNLPSVDSIFIYCASPSKYKYLINNNKKVVTCVSTERELLNQVHWWTELKCSTQLYTCGNDMYRLTKDSSLLLAYLLVVDGIPEGSTKDDLVHFCRAYYAENSIENGNIDEFEANYTRDQAVAWYTKSAFIYKMLKKVLRLFDLNKLYVFAFYIRDLQDQLEKWHHIPTKDFIVFRGLTMSQVNIAQIQANVGNLVAPNGFLSTSRNREVAMKYAKKQGILDQNDDFCNVLLEIEITKDVSRSCIFSDIAHVSAFPDEREILFSIGAVFRINEVISPYGNDTYVIKMKAANDKEYGLINNLLSIARDKFKQYDNQELILQLLQYGRSCSHRPFYFDRLWTWNDVKNGMYATSERAVKALVFGAYRFTGGNVSHSMTEKKVLENRSLNKAEPGFCFYSGVLPFQTALKAAVHDDQNWISSVELNRELASEDFQNFPRTYFIFSNVELPDHLKTLGSKWLHIYHADDQTDFDYLHSEFCHDLAQYYRQTAQRLLREHNDRLTASCFLDRSTRLYQQLEKASEERLERFAKISPSSMCKTE